MLLVSVMIQYFQKDVMLIIMTDVDMGCKYKLINKFEIIYLVILLF